MKGFEICSGGTELILHVLSQNATVAQRIGSPKSSQVTAEKKKQIFLFKLLIVGLGFLKRFVVERCHLRF